jgi:hypothetical protein
MKQAVRKDEANIFGEVWMKQRVDESIGVAFCELQASTLASTSAQLSYFPQS